MPIFIDQPSFAAGEISPDAQARVDIAKYKSAAKTLRNFQVGTKGITYNRPGTRFVGAAKFNDREARLIPFVFSTDVSYMLEFGDEYIRFFKDGGEILEDTANSVIPFWDTGSTYAIDNYVLHLDTDFNIRLYQSLAYGNIAQNPETSPTYWTSIAVVVEWNSGTTYGSGDYVYATRTDGKRKLFISQLGSNLNNNPLLPAQFWTEAKPDVYSGSTTYSIGDYVSYTDQFGNVSIYRSMRDNNTGHNIFSEVLWWSFWNGNLLWDISTAYVVGDFSIIEDGGVFKCFQSVQDGTGHNPLTSGTIYWAAFDAPAIYEVTTAYAWEDLALLKYVQSADTLYLVHPNYAPRILQRTADNDWTISDYDFQNGPFRIPNTDDDREIFATLSAGQYYLNTEGAPSFHLFVEEMVGALFQLNYSLPAQSQYLQYSATTTGDAMRCGGGWRIITSGTWNGIIEVQRSDDAGATYQTIQSFNSTSDLNFNSFGDEELGTPADPDLDNFLIRVKFTRTSGTANITFVRDAFNHVGLVEMTEFVIPAQAKVAVIREVITIDTVASWGGIGAENLVILWAEGAWSDYRGWPQTVAFAQDRLVFGGNQAEPQTEWMTRAGDYVDFGRSSPLIDSDGITVNLLSRQINRIRSLVSFLNSVISFTGSAEFSVQGISDGPLTPTNVFTKLQGVRGSGDVDPIVVGGNIIFISPISTAVRAMNFDLIKDSFDAPSISTIADHLLIGYSIVSMAYQQEPDSTIWMVRSDGTLISVAYLKEEELNAWTHHDTQDGLFESLAVIPGTDADEVWCMVKRGNLRFIERILKRTISTDPADQYFVDCGLVYDGAPVTSLSGLDHLNGQQVRINAEGFVLPLQTVTAGAITLDQARSKVIVGVPITADIELLNPEYPLKDGTCQGRKYQINSCAIRFLNSRGGFVGQDEDSLTQEVNERDPALAAATPTPLFTGYPENQIPVPQSADSRGHLFFRQTDPMPCTILAITTMIEPGQQG